MLPKSSVLEILCNFIRKLSGKTSGLSKDLEKTKPLHVCYRILQFLQSAAKNQTLQPFTGGNRELGQVFQPLHLPVPWVHICSPTAILQATSGVNTAPVLLHVLCIHSSHGSLLPHQFARKTYRIGGFWPATNYKIKNLCAKWAQLHQPLLSYMQTCQMIATSLRLNWDVSEPMSKA